MNGALTLLLIAVFGWRMQLVASAEEYPRDAQIGWPSPNGHFAIRHGVLGTGLISEIIDPATGTVRFTIADARIDQLEHGDRFIGEALWSRDSQWLAISMQVVKHSAWVALYRQKDGKFSPQKLPTLSGPRIPT